MLYGPINLPIERCRRWMELAFAVRTLALAIACLPQCSMADDNAEEREGGRERDDEGGRKNGIKEETLETHTKT